MTNDDSRDLQTPDRPTKQHTLDASSLTDAARLEVIDRLAANLLSEYDDEDVTRHLREIRAEAASAHRALPETDEGVVRRQGTGTTSWLGPVPGTYRDERDDETRPASDEPQTTDDTSPTDDETPTTDDTSPTDDTTQPTDDTTQPPADTDGGAADDE